MMADLDALADNTKTVLVHLRERVRPVEFMGSAANLLAAIRGTFRDVLRGDEELVVQIKDESWGGVFVDITDQEVENRSQLKVIVVPPPPTVPATVFVSPETESQKGAPQVASSRPVQMQLAASSSGEMRVKVAPKPEIDVVCLEEHKSLGDERIREMATIFKKESKRPLTNYQRRINEAAQDLCVENPGLLHKRKELMEVARSKIIEEGFQFVKGKSRSKKEADQDGDKPAPKRRKYSQDMREQRMKSIEEDCRDLTDRIRYKEKRITACENIRDYRKCDELKEEAMALKKQHRLLKAELKHLQKSNSQSAWYYKRKAQSSEKESSTQSTRSFSESERSRSTTPLPIEGPRGAPLRSRSTTPLPASSPSDWYSPSPQICSPESPSLDDSNIQSDSFSPLFKPQGSTHSSEAVRTGLTSGLPRDPDESVNCGATHSLRFLEATREGVVLDYSLSPQGHEKLDPSSSAQSVQSVMSEGYTLPDQSVIAGATVSPHPLETTQGGIVPGHTLSPQSLETLNPSFLAQSVQSGVPESHAIPDHSVIAGVAVSPHAPQATEGSIVPGHSLSPQSLETLDPF